MHTEKPYYLYIILCADDSFYVGRTKNLKVRLKEHSCGRAAPYTAVRLPVSLVYIEKHPNAGTARRREIQLKSWSRAKKIALIEDDLGRLRRLCKSDKPR